MSKRFIDTEIFDDSWFMDLSKDGKLLWIYMITKCNHAGIIDFNKKLVSLQTGISNFDTVFKELNNRIITVKDNLFFIPKFIHFQYPNFPKSKVKQQDSAISILSKYDLLKHLNLTVNKELNNSYGNDYDNDNGNVISNYKEDFLKDFTRTENIAKIYHTTPAKIQGLKEEFITFVTPDNQIYKNFDAVISHFKNWCGKKELSAVKKEFQFPR